MAIINQVQWVQLTVVSYDHLFRVETNVVEQWVWRSSKTHKNIALYIKLIIFLHIHESIVLES